MVPCRSGQTAQSAKLLYRRFESDWNLNDGFWMVARVVIVLVANQWTRQYVVRGFDPLTIRILGL